MPYASNGVHVALSEKNVQKCCFTQSVSDIKIHFNPAVGSLGLASDLPTSHIGRSSCSGERRRPGADAGTSVKKGVFTAFSQLKDRLPGPSTPDLKAGVHHLSLKEAYGPTWSSLGSSLAKSTFGRPPPAERCEAAAGRSSRDFEAVKVRHSFTYRRS